MSPVLVSVSGIGSANFLLETFAVPWLFRKWSVGSSWLIGSSR
jgi:hypothetical protein